MEAATSGVCSSCGANGTLKCSGCLSVFYCGKKHQKKDWPQHKLQCCACEVVSSPELGYYLVASRDLNEGDVILAESPFVIGPVHSASVPYCIGCCRGVNNPAPAICPRCKWPLCSRDCPGLTDPSGHAAECAFIRPYKKTDGKYPWAIIVPFRCILLKNRNPKMWDWILENIPNAQTKAVNKDHSGSFVSFGQNLISSCSIGDIPAALPNNISLPMLMKIFAVINAYAPYFRTSVPVRELAALYKTAGYLQQSCVPNTRSYFEDYVAKPSGSTAGVKLGRIIVRAVKSIQKGEILTCSYVLPIQRTIKRQADLLDYKNMRCLCPRCSDPRELGCDFGTMKCTKCPGWILPVNASQIESCDWKCDRNCGQKLTSKKAAGRFTSCLDEYYPAAQSCVAGRWIETGVLEAMLQKLLIQLHPNHELCFALKILILRSYVNSPGSTEISKLTDKELEKREVLGQDVVDILDSVGPLCRGEHMAARYLWELGRTKAEILNRKFSFGDWTDDRAIRTAVECRTLFERAMRFSAMTNLPSDMPTPMPEAITKETSALLTWVSENDLTLPGEGETSSI